MNRLQLYELRSRALMLARFPMLYREETSQPIDPALAYVLRFMEEQAGPLCQALTAEVNRAEGAGHSASVRCARCGEWRDFSQVRLYPPAPGRAGPEAVCQACLADEREHEMARANAGVDAHREDDACERAGGRED